MSNKSKPVFTTELQSLRTRYDSRIAELYTADKVNNTCSLSPIVQLRLLRWEDDIIVRIGNQKL